MNDICNWFVVEFVTSCSKEKCNCEKHNSLGTDLFFGSQEELATLVIGREWKKRPIQRVTQLNAGGTRKEFSYLEIRRILSWKNVPPYKPNQKKIGKG